MAKYVLQIIEQEYFMYMNYCDETLYLNYINSNLRYRVQRVKQVIKIPWHSLVMTLIFGCALLCFSDCMRGNISMLKSQGHEIQTKFARLERSLFYHDHWAVLEKAFSKLNANIKNQKKMQLK